MENHMEDNDIPKFRTYRGEIEFEGTLIQADIFIDNKMLEDRNSFLISFLCKSNKMYKMICRNVLKKEGYYINLSNRQISRRMDTHGIIVVERFATFHYY